MKTIAAFHFDPDNGFSLDLSDAACAVEVLGGSGDVVLREGPQPERLHRVVFPGDKVVRFDVDRYQAQALVRFWSIGPEGERVYELGTTSDAKSAENWVARVNQLYVDRSQLLSARTEGFRTGNFKHQPAVHDVLETRQTRVLPGAYTYCAEDGAAIPSRLEAWETFFCERQLSHLREHTGFNESIEIVPLTRVPHNYRWMERSVRYGHADFSDRVTQSLELIFDRQERHDKLGVIPFGAVDNFAVVYVEGSSAHKQLALAPHETVASSFSEWLERVSSTNGKNNRVLVCTPASHSIDYSVYNATVRGQLSPEQYESEIRPGSLANWLYDNDQRGVVVCDVGWAYEVARIFAAHHSNISVRHSLVPYEAPVRVGFCYRSDDPAWGKLVSEALVDCLTTDVQEVKESFQQFRLRALKVGIRLAA